jgi:hypothetical protein
VHYIVIPQTHVFISIEHFSNRSDLIDLRAFKEEVRGMGDLSITRGSAIIHIARNHTIRLGDVYPDDIDEKNFLFWEEEGPPGELFDDYVESGRDKDVLLVFVVISCVVVFIVPVISPVATCLRDRYDTRKVDKKGKVYHLFNEEENISFNSVVSDDISDDDWESDSSRSGDSKEEREGERDSLHYGLWDQPMASKMMDLPVALLSSSRTSSSDGGSHEKEEVEKERSVVDESSCDSLDSPVWSSDSESSSSDNGGE